MRMLVCRPVVPRPWGSNTFTINQSNHQLFVFFVGPQICGDLDGDEGEGEGGGDEGGGVEGDGGEDRGAESGNAGGGVRQDGAGEGRGSQGEGVGERGREAMVAARAEGPG